MDILPSRPCHSDQSAAFRSPEERSKGMIGHRRYYSSSSTNKCFSGRKYRDGVIYWRMLQRKPEVDSISVTGLYEGNSLSWESWLDRWWGLFSMVLVTQCRSGLLVDSEFFMQWNNWMMLCFRYFFLVSLNFRTIFIWINFKCQCFGSKWLNKFYVLLYLA